MEKQLLFWQLRQIYFQNFIELAKLPLEFIIFRWGRSFNSTILDDKKYNYLKSDSQLPKKLFFTYIKAL